MSETAGRKDSGEGRLKSISAIRAMVSWMEEIAPYGIFTTDLELRITSWNQWLVAHSGLTLKQVLGKPLQEVCPELESRRLLEHFARALTGEVSILSAALHKYLMRLPGTMPESGIPFMLQTARVAPLPDGTVIVGTITIIEDVTQREFQAGIVGRQQELDRLLSSALAALLQTSQPLDEIAKIFTAVTPALGLDAYASYLLMPDGKTLQLHGSLGIAPKARELLSSWTIAKEEFQAMLRASIDSQLELPSLVAALRKSGLRGCCCFPLSVGDRVIGLVWFGSYQLEAIAPLSANVLARITHYVAFALDRERREREILASSRAKDDFLAALSHELRTPLNPVLLVASDSAANPDYPEEAREAFRVIERNVLLEAKLIDDLLDLTRIGHGKISLELQALNVHTLLAEAIAMVQGEINEKHLDLSLQLCAETSFVLGDSARLHQVIWNVLKNAVKFTPAGGKISVTTRRNPVRGEIVIEVADSGIGMTAAEVDRVFTAFAQGDHAAGGRGHRFGGLGLGLAISRQLLELHSGSIEAASAGRDHGSTFTIRLPWAQLPAIGEAPSNPAMPAGDADLAGRPAEPNARRRILLVEDHEPTLGSLTSLLERRRFQVVGVPSAQAAVIAAAANRFDLVLSDIGLPDQDGYALMRQLRDVHGLKGIALTGYGMEEDVERGRAAGFVAHLIKPISVSVLDRTLEKAFAAAPVRVHPHE